MKNRELLFISIVFFLTVVAWIAIDIYHISQENVFIPENPQFAQPIRITIDPFIFTLLEQKN